MARVDQTARERQALIEPAAAAVDHEERWAFTGDSVLDWAKPRRRNKAAAIGPLPGTREVAVEMAPCGRAAACGDYSAEAQTKKGAPVHRCSAH